jgi:hypothetical protein
MSKTVSTRETSVLTEQCDQCRLWFSALHPAPDGTRLCRLCLEVSGLNRPARWSR